MERTSETVAPHFKPAKAHWRGGPWRVFCGESLTPAPRELAVVDTRTVGSTVGLAQDISCYLTTIGQGIQYVPDIAHDIERSPLVEAVRHTGPCHGEASAANVNKQIVEADPVALMQLAAAVGLGEVVTFSRVARATSAAYDYAYLSDELHGASEIVPSLDSRSSAGRRAKVETENPSSLTIINLTSRRWDSLSAAGAGQSANVVDIPAGASVAHDLLTNYGAPWDEGLFITISLARQRILAESSQHILPGETAQYFAYGTYGLNE